MTIWGDASRLQHSWFRIELLLDPIPLVPNDGVFGKCSQKLAPGMRYLTCCLIHVDLKAALSLLAQDRSSLDKQLCKTTMSPYQHQADHLHGPVTFAFVSGGSSQSTALVIVRVVSMDPARTQRTLSRSIPAVACRARVTASMSEVLRGGESQVGSVAAITR